MAERAERVKCWDHLKDNIAAFTAISAIRPPMGDIFFPPEMDDPVPALSRLNIYKHFINKHMQNDYINDWPLGRETVNEFRIHP